MDVKILGPLEARQDGAVLTLTASKPRQIFALLAIYAGELVTVPTLIDELWGTNAPRSAVQSIQTYILRLRQAIEETLPAGARAGKDVLITRPCGYTLDIAPQAIDVCGFQQLAVAGERAMEAGDYSTASRLLSGALGRWRGPALVDVRVGPQLSIEVARLEQSRLSVLESRIDADLGLGQHRMLLSELAELTTRYPMHEKLCTQYMAALYASGCKWRALEVFRTLRQNLVDELGIEPSAQVQRLQRAILNADTELDWTTAWTPRQPSRRLDTQKPDTEKGQLRAVRVSNLAI
jgi:SARP family transcriptional regulator, regulator of embCAB operon